MYRKTLAYIKIYLYKHICIQKTKLCQFIILVLTITMPVWFSSNLLKLDFMKADDNQNYNKVHDKLYLLF